MTKEDAVVGLHVRDEEFGEGVLTGWKYHFAVVRFRKEDGSLEDHAMIRTLADLELCRGLHNKPIVEG